MAPCFKPNYLKVIARMLQCTLNYLLVIVQVILNRCSLSGQLKKHDCIPTVFLPSRTPWRFCFKTKASVQPDYFWICFSIFQSLLTLCVTTASFSVLMHSQHTYRPCNVVLLRHNCAGYPNYILCDQFSDSECLLFLGFTLTIARVSSIFTAILPHLHACTVTAGEIHMASLWFSVLRNNERVSSVTANFKHSSVVWSYWICSSLLHLVTQIFMWISPPLPKI